MLTITEPPKNAKFKVGAAIKVKGTAPATMTEVILTSPYKGKVYHLGTVKVEDGKWAFTRKFSSSGTRTIVVSPVQHVDGQETAAVEIRITPAGFQKPVQNAVVTSRFGWRDNRFHHGTDIGGVPSGAAVHAVGDGVVTERKTGCAVGNSGCGGGYGNFVAIVHKAEGYESFYAHLASVAVQIGQGVAAGEVIGGLGNTGRSTGPHLHIEMKRLSDGVRVDPAKVITPIV